MATKTAKRGDVIYDSEWGHVCTCTERLHPHSENGMRTDYSQVSYDNTVVVDRESGTESGSFYYSCTRCSAGTWSGL